MFYCSWTVLLPWFTGGTTWLLVKHYNIFLLWDKYCCITTTNSMYLFFSRFWKCCSCAHAYHLCCLIGLQLPQENTSIISFVTLFPYGHFFCRLISFKLFLNTSYVGYKHTNVMAISDVLCCHKTPSPMPLQNSLWCGQLNFVETRQIVWVGQITQY
jgi:hypothetical protein